MALLPLIEESYAFDKVLIASLSSRLSKTLLTLSKAASILVFEPLVRLVVSIVATSSLASIIEVTLPSLVNVTS